MPDQFFALDNAVELLPAEPLLLERARVLLDAIHAHPDFILIQRCRSTDGSGSECLVVEVECHGVPGRNRHGILCPERTALVVHQDPARLLDVLMLRKSFPLLMHQNQPTADRPASLCLYFDPPASVFRNWTPQRFLQRILWWLERSAKDELHPIDQPVEGLFFASRYELVLPWNYDALRADATQRLATLRGPERPDHGVTFYLEAIPSDGKVRLPPITHLSLDLPPIVHGTVAPDPATLGDLSDVLQGRGVDLFAPLRDELRSQISAAGVPVEQDTQHTVIVLHIPIQRKPDEPPYVSQQRAFLALTGGYKLGESMGALFLHGGKYFNAEGLFGVAPKIEWRAQQVMPVAVLRYSDSEAARRYSGITEPGPKGLLIGAGSLGSAMLNLWGRSGWGQWTVVDKDHIKPHNLARHTAYAQHVGTPKAEVAADLHAAMSRGASTVTAVVTDTCNFTQEPMASALRASELVIDASTTLEYPRAVSAENAVPRHISVFITPNGNSAVLLAEDRERKQRLRTLEAQYYRALIEQDWGGQHLDGAKAFWSGASCRDISVVLAYSRIQAHASTLAEQIPLAAGQAEARIRIWQRDPDSGATTVHTVPVHDEEHRRIGEFDAFVDEGVKQSLRAMRRAQLPQETGGVLVGYYDFTLKAVIIVAALAAPPDSKGTRGGFKRGTEGLPERIAEISRRTTGIVGYIGEWHSHPPCHSARPSTDDLIQLAHLAQTMAADGLPGVQLIVGENDISLLQGTVLASG